ncbi:MAG: zinc-ribbon domain-containing protein [Fastidiosipilaceae bacterium]|jgi:TM2 domain-containing membrane protein YozV
MYCSNCGSQMAEDAKFCPNCGKGTGDRPRASGTYGVVYTEKSAGLAAVLSIIIVGAGQMYAGKVGRGIIILLFSLFGIGFLYVPSLLAVVTGAMSVGGALMLGSVLVLAWYVFVVYDAYRQAEIYNGYLRENGHPPW